MTTNERSLRFEALESKRLLAADLMNVGAMETVDLPAEPCMVASAEYPQECISCSADPNAEQSTDGSDVDAQLENDDVTPTQGDVSNEVESLDPRNLNLDDGMDGYFGEINAENPSETLSFTAQQDGMVDVVVASSFGDSQTQVTVTDSDGMVVEASVDGLEGFNVLTFEAKENEVYEVSITSDNPESGGRFQMTVGFEAFVDQHADAMGQESTEITLTDNTAELDGRLENGTDVDTFRFTATDSGEVLLGLQETVENERIGLNISVQDENGNDLVGGATNELVFVSFDVEAGQEYFISLNSSDSLKSTYQLGLELRPDAGTETPVDLGSGSETPADQPSENQLDDQAVDQVDDVENEFSDPIEDEPEGEIVEAEDGTPDGPIPVTVIEECPPVDSAELIADESPEPGTEDQATDGIDANLDETPTVETDIADTDPAVGISGDPTDELAQTADTDEAVNTDAELIAPEVTPDIIDYLNEPTDNVADTPTDDVPTDENLVEELVGEIVDELENLEDEFENIACDIEFEAVDELFASIGSELEEAIGDQTTFQFFPRFSGLNFLRF